MPDTKSPFGEQKTLDNAVRVREDWRYAFILLSVMALLIVIQFSFDWHGLVSRYVYRSEIEAKLVQETVWRRDLNDSLGKHFNSKISVYNFDFDREMQDIHNRIEAKKRSTTGFLLIFDDISWVLVVWLMYSWKRDGRREKAIQLLYAHVFPEPNHIIRSYHLRNMYEEEPVKALVIGIAYVSMVFTTAIWICIYTYNEW